MRGRRRTCADVRLAVVLMALALCLSGSTLCKDAAAQAPGRSEQQGQAGRLPSYLPYCGVECLYAVLRLAGKQLEMSQLLRPEYVGSRKGSSLAELTRAAEDYGMYAVALTGLTTRDLRRLQSPIILHVRGTASVSTFDHYLLYLGAEGGQARIFDPPGPATRISFRDLAARWSGTGLVVSSSPVNVDALLLPSRVRLLFWAAIVVAAVVTIRWVRSRYLPGRMLTRVGFLSSTAIEACGVTVACMLLALMYHFVAEQGLLADPGMVSDVRQAHAATFLPRIDRDDVAELIDTSTVFVDARRSADFESGHVPGAVNVPVNASDALRREALADVPKSAQIVVYCQSRSCAYAKQVAVKLVADGFENVALFPGGWREWERHD